MTDSKDENKESDEVEVNVNMDIFICCCWEFQARQILFLDIISYMQIQSVIVRSTMQKYWNQTVKDL